MGTRILISIFGRLALVLLTHCWQWRSVVGMVSANSNCDDFRRRESTCVLHSLDPTDGAHLFSLEGERQCPKLPSGNMPVSHGRVQLWDPSFFFLDLGLTVPATNGSARYRSINRGSSQRQGLRSTSSSQPDLVTDIKAHQCTVCETASLLRRHHDSCQLS